MNSITLVVCVLFLKDLNAKNLLVVPISHKNSRSSTQLSDERFSVLPTHQQIQSRSREQYKGSHSNELRDKVWYNEESHERPQRKDQRYNIDSWRHKARAKVRFDHKFKKQRLPMDKKYNIYVWYLKPRDKVSYDHESREQRQRVKKKRNVHSRRSKLRNKKYNDLKYKKQIRRMAKKLKWKGKLSHHRRYVKRLQQFNKRNNIQSLYSKNLWYGKNAPVLPKRALRNYWQPQNQYHVNPGYNQILKGYSQPYLYNTPRQDVIGINSKAFETYDQWRGMAGQPVMNQNVGVMGQNNMNQQNSYRSYAPPMYKDGSQTGSTGAPEQTRADDKLEKCVEFANCVRLTFVS